LEIKSKRINLADLIFILFYKYKGEIRGITTLQKLIDIIRLDSDLDIEIDYSPYNYGDFAPEVNDVIQVFLDNSWLIKDKKEYENGKKIEIFKLTSNGYKIAKTLYNNLLYNELKSLEVIDKFLNKRQEEIISFSYFWYPQTAINSKIRRNIFKKKSILSVLDGELEEEYYSIIKSGCTIKDIIRKSWKY